MNDTRSSAGTKAQEMLELAERLDKMKSPYGDYRGYSLHYKERDMIVAALRLAAQPQADGVWEALEPFAKLAKAGDDFGKEDEAKVCLHCYADGRDVFVTYGDLRRARSVFTALSSDGKPGEAQGAPSPSLQETLERFVDVAGNIHNVAEKARTALSVKPRAELGREDIARTLADQLFFAASYRELLETEQKTLLEAADAILALTRPASHQSGGAT